MLDTSSSALSTFGTHHPGAHAPRGGWVQEVRHCPLFFPRVCHTHEPAGSPFTHTPLYNFLAKTFKGRFQDLGRVLEVSR